VIGFALGTVDVVTGTDVDVEDVDGAIVVDVEDVDGAIVVEVEDVDGAIVVAVGFSAAPGLGGFKISAQLDGIKNCACANAGESSKAVPVAVSS
jgi:hypothetical protein